MGMEKVDYRATLAYLLELFEGKQIVNVAEVARAFNCDRRVVKRRYPFTDNKIEVTRLASQMSLSANEVRRAYHVPEKI